MLTREIAIGVAVYFLAASTPALADGSSNHTDKITVSGDNRGVVQTSVSNPGQPARHRTASTGSGSGASALTCTWTENSAYLEGFYVNWIGWGRKRGHWYDVRCSDGSTFPSLYVPPAATNIPPAVVLAGVIAQRAVNRLRLPRPQVALNPQRRALVNLPEWFWVPRSQWRGLTQRTQAGPVWAVVSARPESVTWDPGDGSVPVTCAGPGTPYDRSRSADAQQTNCSYTYRRSSAGQPQSGPDANDRFFTVTVTVRWAISWTGSAGASGSLPVMTRSTSFPLAVAQREAVVTGGSG